MLPREHRLRRASDFARARKQGRAWSHPLLVLTVVPNGETVTRVGFSVSKRVGKATVRNRTRRLLREAVRAALPQLRPGFDLVISCRPAIADQSHATVVTAVQRVFRQAHMIETGRETG